MQETQTKSQLKAKARYQQNDVIEEEDEEQKETG